MSSTSSISYSAPRQILLPPSPRLTILRPTLVKQSSPPHQGRSLKNRVTYTPSSRVSHQNRIARDPPLSLSVPLPCIPEESNQSIAYHQSPIALTSSLPRSLIEPEIGVKAPSPVRQVNFQHAPPKESPPRNVTQDATGCFSLISGTVVGLIAGLALGIIFGPIAALIGFCGGGAIGALVCVLTQNCWRSKKLET